MAKKDANEQMTESTQSRAEPQPRKAADNIHISGIALTIFMILMLVTFVGAVLLADIIGDWTALFVTIMLLVSFIILFALKVAKQWEKAVVLRLGRFSGLRGPGMFWILPIIDTTPLWIDHRVMVTPFNAEKTLTRDAT